MRHAVLKLLFGNRLATKICTQSTKLRSSAFTRTSKNKYRNYSWDSLATFEYRFHWILRLPHHLGEFIAKCWSNVLAVECIQTRAAVYMIHIIRRSRNFIIGNPSYFCHRINFVEIEFHHFISVFLLSLNWSKCSFKKAWTFL